MRVRVGPIDDSFGGRSIDVRHPKLSFETPHRVLSSTEANYKSRVGCDDPFPSGVLEIMGFYDDDGLRRLKRKNGIFARKSRAIRALKEMYPDMLSMYQVHHPRGSIQQSYDQSDLKMLVELQIDAGVDLVCIPDMSVTSKPKQFMKDQDRWSEYVLSESHAVPVPRIDMAADGKPFREKVKLLVDGDYPALSLRYRAWRSHTANFLTIWEHRDEDVWFHSTGTDRITSDNWRSSGVHLPQRWGIDTATRATIMPPETPPPRVIGNIRRFDASTCGILKLKEYERRHGEALNCNCPICQGLRLQRFIAKYARGSDGTRDPDRLDLWMKIHEVFSGTQELAVSRDYISDGRFREYVKEREFLIAQIQDASVRSLDEDW